MDFNALQHKLFELDPSDPREDLAKLTQAAGGDVQKSVASNINYVQESVEVPEGSLDMDRDYSVTDFAALAGVQLNEGWEDVKKAAKHGWKNYNTIDALRPNKDKDIKNPGDKDKKEKNKYVSPSKSKVTKEDDRIAQLEARVAQLEAMLQEGGASYQAVDVTRKRAQVAKRRNPVASHAQSSGSGAHTDKSKQIPRKQKHKKQVDTESSYKEMLLQKLNNLK